MDIAKCADEVRRGLRDYREYAHSDKFLDEMDENAEGIVAGLVPYEKDFRKVKEWILEYVLGSCTGLENTDGDVRFILYPRVAFTVDGVLSALGVPVNRDSRDSKSEESENTLAQTLAPMERQGKKRRK